MELKRRGCKVRGTRTVWRAISVRPYHAAPAGYRFAPPPAAPRIPVSWLRVPGCVEGRR